MILETTNPSYHQIRPILNEMFEVCTRYMMTYSPEVINAFQLRHSTALRGSLAYPPTFAYYSKNGCELYRSPVYHFLVENDSPLLATRYDTVSLLLDSVASHNLGKICSKVGIRSLEQVKTIKAFMGEIEFLFAMRQLTQWPVFMVQLAKKWELLWAYPHITSQLKEDINPASTKEQTMVNESSISKATYAPTVGIAVYSDDCQTDSVRYTDRIGKRFHIVTEEDNPRFLEVEVTNVNIEYSKAFPNGREVTVAQVWVPPLEKFERDSEQVRIYDWNGAVIMNEEQSKQFTIRDIQWLLRSLAKRGISMDKQ